MSKTLTHDTTEDGMIDYRAATIECLEKIDRMLAEMKESHEKTAQLRKETWEILDRLKAA